jgi:aryl-alcohol dehydrogenase-like predicted oxidoreductase
VKDVAIGCDQLGGHGWTNIDAREAQRTIREAAEAGIRFFDTADVYGLGESERRLGKALGTRRYDVCVVTKVGLRRCASSGKVIRDCRPGYLRDAVQASAQRLSLEPIPVVLLHWPDTRVPLAESIGALQALRDEGVVREIGACNVAANELAGLDVEWTQRRCSLLSPVERSPSPEWARAMAWGCLEQGLLGASPRDGLDKQDRRRRDPFWRDSVAAVIQPLRDALQRCGRPLGLSAAQCAVRWVLDATPIDVAVVGVHTMQHLREVIGIRDAELGEHDRLRLQRHAREARDRLAGLGAARGGPGHG